MVKKLKIRLLSVNLILLVFLIFGVLASVFFMMYGTEIRQSKAIIDETLDIHMGDDYFSLTTPPRRNLPNDAHNDTIYLLLNMNLDLLDSEYQFFQITEQQQENALIAAKTIIQMGAENEGIVSIDGTSFRYKYLLTVDSLRANYSVVLLNRAVEMKNIKNLALAMVKIGTLALLFCVLLSILLSNWAVKPTKIAFDKQNRFISDAAHELKTPLTVITANIDTAVSNPESTIGEQRKWLVCVQNESMRMANLVNELLMIARTDNNVKQLKEKFDLSRAVEDICIGLEVVVFENKKELITDIQKDIFYNGNENAIKQLLTILIDNAMKYSTAGSIITVNLAKNSKKCRIVVHNTGSEIPKDDLKHIFERFYRVDKSRTKSTGGVGLGLNIAKNIVAEHNGTISCKSGNNTTCFVIIL